MKENITTEKIIECLERFRGLRIDFATQEELEKNKDNENIIRVDDAIDEIIRLKKRVDYYKDSRNKYQDDVLFLSKRCDELQEECDELQNQNYTLLERIEDLLGILVKQSIDLFNSKIISRSEYLKIFKNLINETGENE